MSDVFGPYHFVPLSKWVYQPDWAHLVSHDHPLEKGLSGRIKLTLRNKSPLCVGGARNPKSNKVKWFRDPTGKPIIPATSIKGMLRNVLEIATFAKFQAVDDVRFSYRDVSRGSEYLQKIINNKNKVAAGWLKYNTENKQWELRLAEHLKVKHDDLNELLGTKIKNNSDAVDKYKKLPLTKKISGTRKEAANTKTKPTLVNLNLNNQGLSGHMVFCNNRVVEKKNPPEFYEFSYFFYNEKVAVTYNNLADMVADFEFSHNEEQVNYLKEHGHPELGMPVFALFQGQQLKSIGLAQMPRVGYSHSTHDLIENHAPEHHWQSMFDLPELLFGTIKDKGLSLKSRITLSDLSLHGNSKVDWYSGVVLNSPKPTFQNAYLEANGGKLDTYNNKSARLSGWKRYITKSSTPEELIAENDKSNPSQNKNIQSNIEALMPNAEFKGELFFHNLLPQELGALLWCITWGESKQHQHLLGHGKPLGFGRVTIEPSIEHISANNGSEVSSSVSQYIQIFTSLMNQVHPAQGEQSWQQSPQLSYLLEMANPEQNKSIKTHYMGLQTEHKAIKNSEALLKPLHGIKRAESLLNKEKMLSDSFGKGRLADLIPDVDMEQKRLVANAKNNLNYRLKQEAERISQATLTPLELAFKDVQQKINSFVIHNQTQNIAPELRGFIEQAISVHKNAPEQVTEQIKRNVLALASEHQFNEKPKKQRANHRKLLADFRLLKLYE